MHITQDLAKHFNLSSKVIELPFSFVESVTPEKLSIPKNVMEQLSNIVETFKFRIEPRNYDSIPALLRPINEGIYEVAPYARNHVRLKWSRDMYRVEWKCKFHFVKLDMSMTLSKLLGFTKSNLISVGTGTLIAPDPLNLQFSLSTLWVYTDIIEPVVVGDTMANLLRIVPVKGISSGSDSKTIIRVYERPHYVNLATNPFQIVEVMLNTTYGLAPILFKDPVIVKLHFRRKKVLHLQ